MSGGQVRQTTGSMAWVRLECGHTVQAYSRTLKVPKKARCPHHGKGQRVQALTHRPT